MGMAFFRSFEKKTETTSCCEGDWGDMHIEALMPARPQADCRPGGLQVMPAAGSCLRAACKSVAVDVSQPFPAFPQRASALAREAWQRVYADKASPARAERGQLLQLLRQHLQDGLLRLGKRWLRQTRGIPQARPALTPVYPMRQLIRPQPITSSSHSIL